jgi:hypothetical protein
MTLLLFAPLATGIVAFFAGIVVGQAYGPVRFVTTQRRDRRGRYVR